MHSEEPEHMPKYLVNVQDVVQRELVISQKRTTPDRTEKFYYFGPQSSVASVASFFLPYFELMTSLRAIGGRSVQPPTPEI